MPWDHTVLSTGDQSKCPHPCQNGLETKRSWRNYKFWQDPPQFFHGPKKRKFYYGANRHFLTCDANSQKPANKDWGKLLDIRHTCFPLTNDLFFLKNPPQFLKAQNVSYVHHFRQGLELAAYFSTTGKPNT